MARAEPAAQPALSERPLYLETRTAPAWAGKTHTFQERCVAFGVPVGPKLPGAPTSGYHERVPARLDAEYIKEREYMRDRDLARVSAPVEGASQPLVERSLPSVNISERKSCPLKEAGHTPKAEISSQP
eukprot:COSAG01_NODE_25667_length_737_cov_2.028213_1_plen_129_part_00